MNGTLKKIAPCCICLLLVSASPCLGVQIFLDTYDPAPAPVVDLKDISRPPDIGPQGSWALWASEPEDLASTAKAETGLDGLSASAVIDVPAGSAMDYQGWLGGLEYTGRFLLQWSIIVETIDQNSEDLGLFSVRFPTATSGMQILFSFMNDGRLITFNSDPGLYGLDSIEQVGNYQEDTLYNVDFAYDLVDDTYSVSMNSFSVISKKPIPEYLDRISITQFGFDISQAIQIGASPLPPGNTYYVDTISLSLEPATEPVPEPAAMLLFGTGVAGFAFSRLRRRKHHL